MGAAARSLELVGSSQEDASMFDTGEIVPSPLLCPGEVVDRFRVGVVLGIGGHGVVYEAEHVDLGYRVALKVMERGAGFDARRRARFRRETLVGARVRHRNVVSILEAGELTNGAPYLVMEHIDGIELAALIAQRPLEPTAVIDLGLQLMAALAALTEVGIVHRDIKPQNVMVRRAPDGVVEAKLLDFGICKAGAELAPTLTQDGFVLGTPHYMSPEQIRGDALDVRSDLYATGALLYESLTGVPPIDGDNTESVLTKILLEEPVPLRERRPDCAPELAAVIARAMAKKREARYQTPGAFAEALREVAAQLGFAQVGDAWADRNARLSEARANRKKRKHSLWLVSGNVSAGEARRFMPTPAECPSAIRARRRTPRFPPPWWPAVAFLVLTIFGGLTLGSIAVAAAEPAPIRLERWDDEPQAKFAVAATIRRAT